MQVDNLKVLAAFNRLIAKAGKARESVVVGATGEHALALHEMTPKHIGKPRRSGKGTYWGPSGFGNKWLESPARQYAKQIGKTIGLAYKASKGDLLKSLEVGGLLLQAEMMKRMPYEYGDLARSAFTERE